MTRLDVILAVSIVVSFTAGYFWGRGCELIDGVRSDARRDEFFKREQLP